MASEPPSPEFNQATEISPSQRIQLALSKTDNQRLIARHEEMCARQEEARKSTEERLKEQREETIRILTERMLEEKTREIHPALRPKYLRGDDQRELRQAAKNDATAYVDAMEKKEMETLDQKFLRDQQRILDQAVSAQGRQSFNRASKDGGQERPDQGLGGSSHGR